MTRETAHKIRSSRTYSAAPSVFAAAIALAGCTVGEPLPATSGGPAFASVEPEEREGLDVLVARDAKGERLSSLTRFGDGEVTLTRISAPNLDPALILHRTEDRESGEARFQLTSPDLPEGGAAWPEGGAVPAEARELWSLLEPLWKQWEQALVEREMSEHDNPLEKVEPDADAPYGSLCIGKFARSWIQVGCVRAWQYAPRAGIVCSGAWAIESTICALSESDYAGGGLSCFLADGCEYCCQPTFGCYTTFCYGGGGGGENY